MSAWRKAARGPRREPRRKGVIPFIRHGWDRTWKAGPQPGTQAMWTDQETPESFLAGGGGLGRD